MHEDSPVLNHTRGQRGGRLLDIMCFVSHPGGGQLQPVRMRPTPQLSVKICGGAGGGEVGGRVGGGGDWQLSRGGSQGGGGCARPTTTTCIPQGCVCAWGHGGIEVCMR